MRYEYVLVAIDPDGYKRMGEKITDVEQAFRAFRAAKETYHLHGYAGVELLCRPIPEWTKLDSHRFDTED